MKCNGTVTRHIVVFTISLCLSLSTTAKSTARISTTRCYYHSQVSAKPKHIGSRTKFYLTFKQELQGQIQFISSAVTAITWPGFGVLIPSVSTGSVYIQDGRLHGFLWSLCEEIHYTEMEVGAISAFIVVLLLLFGLLLLKHYKYHFLITPKVHALNS